MVGFGLAGAGLLDPLFRFLQSRMLEASAGLTLIIAGR